MAVIGITGAAGALGRRATEHVLRSHPPSEVVLLSRSPNVLRRHRDAGVTVRHADFDRPDGLSSGFAGIDVLLLISTDAVSRRRVQHLTAIRAATAAGVKRIAYTSLPNADGEFPARLRTMAADHASTESALRAEGPACTILRNALYMEGYADTWLLIECVDQGGDRFHRLLVRDLFGGGFAIGPGLLPQISQQGNVAIITRPAS
ncbi:NAD(P)H-binding protein [Mycolicibacterium vinylchloridicum]|uniref:NAD(P)H-binding protein n=1 Tax=Mycolicibacterium vinylchloridicum TaxID=2736928 RepID=UPI00022E8D88|nr:NAD(P)H-binding protein [Mycolicibacterium vinylchloridicum]EHB53319.1 hypothetical protein MycrhDRAFT_3782 [Mycolicibacterium rhodesiae JS60]